MVEFDYEVLVKATQSFSASRLMGKGSHGAVYEGILQDNKSVAVKRSSINGVKPQLDNLKKLDNEISILSSLSESPHIISFLGRSASNTQDSVKSDVVDDKLLVMELMPNGTLHDMLHDASATPPPWPKRVEIAMQIAKAVQFLHEGCKPLVIIHRDIKSANILFDSSWTAKLADFGLAVSPTESLSQPAGTIGYLDPCYTAPNKLSTKIDVFSLGVVLLEIISCRKAIDLTKAPASIAEWAIPLVDKQKVKEICDPRVPIPTNNMEGTIMRILSVASRCLSENVDSRPSIGEIVMSMETFSIERVRTISSSGSSSSTRWTSILQSLVLVMKRRRKWTRQCSAIYAAQEGDVNSDISSRKTLLKDIIFADHVTLK